MAALRAGEPLRFRFDDQEVELQEEDLLIETLQQDRYVSETEGSLTVILDTQLTDALIEEGFVREIISKVQTMRKEAGFEVTDTIRVYVSGNDRIQTILEQNRDSILHDVMGVALTVGQSGGYAKEWELNGETVTLGVEKVEK